MSRTNLSSSIRGLLTIICLLWATISAAEESIEIQAIDGSVGVANGKLIRPLSVGSRVAGGSILITSPNSRAVVRVGATGYIVLGKNCRIAIGRPSDHAGLFRQITGMIYYAMHTLKANEQPIHVVTKAATLGIRGTRFLVVNTADREEIGMRKGAIVVTSIGAEFEFYKQTEQRQFDAYKQEATDALAKEQHDFERYQANTQQEFVEFKREFYLAANQMVSFAGMHATTHELSAETKSDMASFEGYADKWLKQVRD